MRKDMLKAHLDGQVFAVHNGAMSNLMAFANGDEPTAASPGTPAVANNSVLYQTKGNVAIISVDGAMAKKGTSGLCMNVASYETIIQAADKAEVDNRIDTVLYRVDTVGGTITGIDEAGDRIFNSKKKTVTFFENVGASGGVWVFSAADELHASEMTRLGSIGVIAAYSEPIEEGTKRISITSQNAVNKACSLSGDCKAKLQATLDQYETLFFDRVERNTGFTPEMIKTTFNNGDVIFAKEAKEAGFIQSVTTFAALLDSLVIIEPIQDSASHGGKLANLNQGANVKFDRENLDDTEAAFNALVQNRETLTTRNDTLTTQLETAQAALEAKGAEFTALTATLAETVASAEAHDTDRETRIREAIELGVTADTAVSMVNADSADAASKLAIAANGSTSGTNPEPNAGEAAAALDKRCDDMNVTFIG